MAEPRSAHLCAVLRTSLCRAPHEALGPGSRAGAGALAVTSTSACACRDDSWGAGWAVPQIQRHPGIYCRDPSSRGLERSLGVVQPNTIAASGLAARWVPGTSPGMTLWVGAVPCQLTSAHHERGKAARQIQCHARTWSEDPALNKTGARWLRARRTALGLVERWVLGILGTSPRACGPEDDTAGWGEAVSHTRCHPGIYCRDPSSREFERSLGVVQPNTIAASGLAARWVPGTSPGMTLWLGRGRATPSAAIRLR